MRVPHVTGLVVLLAFALEAAPASVRIKNVALTVPDEAVVAVGDTVNARLSFMVRVPSTEAYRIRVEVWEEDNHLLPWAEDDLVGREVKDVNLSAGTTDVAAKLQFFMDDDPGNHAEYYAKVTIGDVTVRSVQEHVRIDPRKRIINDDFDRFLRIADVVLRVVELAR
jgi:hypothetical protein